MAFSRLKYPGDGSTVSFAVNFTLGFISRSDVKAYVIGEVDGLGGQLYRTITWINDGLITISGAAPTVGQTLVIERTVSKTALQNDYVNGAAVEAENLDNSNKQAVMLVHEVLDGRFTDPLTGNLDMGNNKIVNLGPATNGGDAVNLTQLQDFTGNAPAYAAAAAASASTATTQAGIATTQAGTATTKAAEALASANAAAASAAGMRWSTPVRVATTANITLSGTQTIDAVAVVAGNRVLVKNQTTQSQNGIYLCAAGTWTRDTDADTWDELRGRVVSVEEGTVNADVIYICTVNSGGTLGTTNVTWADLKVPVQDGGVSTTAKIVDGIVTYLKLASAAIATTAEIIAGTASKLVSVAGLKTYHDNITNSWVRCDTTNGVGSSNGAIRRFVNSQLGSYTTDITYADSATLGASFTINTTGVYAITYTDNFSSINVYFGISKNTANGNQSILVNPFSELLAVTFEQNNSTPRSVQTTVRLAAGDVVRPHLSTSSASAAANLAMFLIQRVA